MLSLWWEVFFFLMSSAKARQRQSKIIQKALICEGALKKNSGFFKKWDFIFPFFFPFAYQVAIPHLEVKRHPCGKFFLNWLGAGFEKKRRLRAVFSKYVQHTHQIPASTSISLNCCDEHVKQNNHQAHFNSSLSLEKSNDEDSMTTIPKIS